MINFCHITMFTVEKKKETITESAGRQQKKKIGKMSYWYTQNLPEINFGNLKNFKLEK